MHALTGKPSCCAKNASTGILRKKASVATKCQCLRIPLSSQTGGALTVKGSKMIKDKKYRIKFAKSYIAATDDKAAFDLYRKNRITTKMACHRIERANGLPHDSITPEQFQYEAILLGYVKL